MLLFCLWVFKTFSVTTSGVTLHLTLREQLTHTVWCCTKALCIIFVLLFFCSPLLFSELCIVWDHVLLTLHVQLPWISFLYWVKTETWMHYVKPLARYHLAWKPSDSRRLKPLWGKRTGSLLVAHHDVDMGLAHDLCSICGMSVRIWKQCCIHVTISFQMLSPIQNFPLKFLYFDIIKLIKMFLVFLWLCATLQSGEVGKDVVHMVDRGCKCWVDSGKQVTRFKL